MSNVPNLFYVIQIVVGIGMLIVAHEFGHFIMAKLAGVRVDIFSIGFGRPIVKFNMGDTEYRLCLIFIGGYVKMAGDPTDEKANGAPDEVSSKGFWPRLGIYVGGPAASALFGIFLFWLAFVVGIAAIVPRVGAVQAASPAEKAGLLPGDLVLSLDEEAIYSWQQFSVDIAIGGENPRVIKVLRDGEEKTLTVHPETDPNNALITRIQARWASGTTVVSELSVPGLDLPIHGGDQITHIAGHEVAHSVDMKKRVSQYIEANPESDSISVAYLTPDGEKKQVAMPIFYDRLIGVRFADRESNEIEEVLPESHAEAMGMKAGDRIVKVNDTEIHGLMDLFNILHTEVANHFEFHLERDGTPWQVSREVMPEGATLPVGTSADKQIYSLGPVQAVGMALIESRNVWRQIKLFFSKLFSKDAAAAKDNIGGPIGIFRVTYEVAKEGPGDLLFILAMISINLAIVNILPIPLLDGGQIMILCVETMKGSPLQQRSQDAVVYVGLLIILSLFIFATLNDIKMITGWGN